MKYSPYHKYLMCKYFNIYIYKEKDKLCKQDLFYDRK